jgi:hypothetical protein
MADNYSVDEILEEVRRKKAASDAECLRLQAQSAQTPAPSDGGRSQPRPAAPFRLTGLTGEFDARPDGAPRHPAARAAAPAADQATRMDLPVQPAPTADPPDAVGATRVMPAVRRYADEDLERRRQEKVRQFMESSFADLDDGQPDAAEPQPEQDENEESIPISQFFGGITRSAISTKKAPKKSAAPDAVGQKDRRGQSESRPSDIEADEDEYNTLSDAPRVRRDIRAIRKSLSIRMAVTAVCFVLSLYLALCNLYPLPLLNPICPEVDMRVFLAVNLVVLLVSALASNSVIGSGLISLFGLKADHDTPAALCTLAVIAHGVALVVVPDSLRTGEGGFYFSVAALVLLCNAVGKHMMIVRIDRNFAVASIDTAYAGEYLLRDSELAHRLAEGQDLENPCIAYSVQTQFPEGFLALSYTDDYAENMSRILAPLFLLFGVALGLMAWLAFDQSAMGALTIFCAVLCMASPLTAAMVGNLPLLRAASRLSGEGAFISGYDAVEQFEDMNAAALDAGDLYPSGTVVLHGIKAFAQSRIDEAILDAASVMCKVDGLLKNIFLEMIGQKTDILKPVDSLSYEDGRGLCAEVDKKRVLIGNRDLMSAYGVDMPSRDYEKKFVKGDREILYLANSGEVTAMFVLSYRPRADVIRWLGALAKKQMGLIIHSTDPNITPGKIASDFHFPEEFVRILPAALRDDYAALTAPRGRGKAHIMSLQGPSVRLRALAAVHTLKRSIVTGTVLQLAGLVLGYAIIAFLSFTGAIGAMGFVQMLTYQLFWAAAVTLLSNLRKI